MKKHLKIISLVFVLILLISAVFAIGAQAADSNEPTVTIKAVNISLDSNQQFKIKYAVSVSDNIASKLQNVKMMHWLDEDKSGKYESATLTTTTVGWQEVGGEKCAIFDFACDMSDLTSMIYSRAYIEIDGVKYYSNVNKYNFITYAYKKQSTSDTKTKDLIANVKALGDMLTAQKLGLSASSLNDAQKIQYRLPSASWQLVRVEDATVEDGFAWGMYLKGDKLSVTPRAAIPGSEEICHFEDASGNEISGNVIEVGDASVEYKAVYKSDVASELLHKHSWLYGTVPTTGNGYITLPANVQLAPAFFKKAWEAGYTHLVFSYESTSANIKYIHYGAGTETRYYEEAFPSNSRTEIRIDISEYFTGDNWYGFLFTGMDEGSTITISNVRLYKSPETLEWTKSNTNIYFAIEDGYYVFRSGGSGYVSSPTEWLANMPANSTWYVYTDYITQGSNYRSLVWGIGAAGTLTDAIGTIGQWNAKSTMNKDGYTDGEMFTLYMDSAGTARVKISDFVSNRTHYGTEYTYEVVDNDTIHFASTFAEHKLYLTNTQELIAQGYTKVTITIEGSFTEGSQLWYGNDDWGTAGCMNGVTLTAGKAVCEFDLSKMTTSNPYLVLMVSGETGVDVEITVTPSKGDVTNHTVTVPSGDSYTVNSNTATVENGGTAYFEIVPNNADEIVVVKNGSAVINGKNNIFAVENVTSDTALTVEVYKKSTSKYLAQMLNGENWSGTVVAGGADDHYVTLTANAQLKAEYLKKLWDAGYTHLVFTVNGTSLENYTRGGDWERYWRTLTGGQDNTIRIDLNEFHDGDTWYGLNFSAGEMTVSNVKAYKSAETLSWTKIGAGKPSNVYFAIEDGYYVLETITAQGVTSPTEWLAKYCVTDDAGQRSFRVYTDYINKGGNTRSLLWGWGEAVNTLSGSVDGGWSWLNGVQTDGYTDGEVFSLHTDAAGTARFKMLDWVSNRNEWNAAQKLEYVDENTIIWSGADSYKIRLATTQDLIAQGYTKLKVTLTGDLGSALIWYGEDDWGDGEVSVGADKFTDGSYTFEVDLTTFKSTESFTLMGNAAEFTDLQIKVVPDEATKENVGGGVTPPAVETPETFKVSVPSGKDYTVIGGLSQIVESGGSASFIIKPTNSNSVIVVKNGNTVIEGNGNVYTVNNVTEDIILTVEAVELFKTVLDEMYSPNNWTTATSTATADSITVGANASLKSIYLQKLWNQGYTHLVFTVNGTSLTNYTHGGDWERYWRNLTGGQDNTIRIDLNEFHDGDTWYGLNFSAGEMTVSNVKAYKSAETLSWTKIGAGTPSNVYFAIEDGYYVLETITAQGVTSPTEWLAKYCVTDDAGQRSFRVYTDYINKGGNTRSLLWGWGSAVDPLSGSVDGGWSWINGVQTDGYTDGEVFSLHTDVAGTARFKMLDWVSNRNEWNAPQKLEYVDENTIIWSGADSYKIRLATTQDLIAQGYTELKVTLTGDLGSALIWYGEDDWSDGEVSVGADKFTDGSYTFEVDLTTFQSTESFTLMGNAAAFANISIKIEPSRETIENAIVINNAGNEFAATVLQKEFAVANGNYMILNADEAKNITFTGNVVYLGMLPDGVNTAFRSAFEGEEYHIYGSGNAVYIDGNSQRAVIYGAYDLLRQCGYEFYTADVVKRPASVAIPTGLNIKDGADFAIRHYLNSNTGYNEKYENLEFTVSSKFNNGGYINLGASLGGQEEYGYYGHASHNFVILGENNAIIDGYFYGATVGTHGKIVATGSSVGEAFAPCLTNGVTYNVGGTDTTLTFAVARMKALMLANPDKTTFTFAQNDGPTWFCDCEYCTASNSSYNNSGTLVNFINEMIKLLEADPELSGREFKIMTFAYDFTKTAPKGGVAIDDKLCIWYAQYQDSRYGITADGQAASFKDDLVAWSSLTKSSGATMALWLYDANFQNYHSYYASTTINDAVLNTVKAAKELGITDIFVQGAFGEGVNSWQADMKAYIWSKVLWNIDGVTSADIQNYQNEFIDAYFGTSAGTYVKQYISEYDALYNKPLNDGNVIVSSGQGYVSYVSKGSAFNTDSHYGMLQIAKDAVNAAKDQYGENSAEWKRANAVLASSYAALVYWDGYDDDFKTACANAGITRICEGYDGVQAWLDNN